MVNKYLEELLRSEFRTREDQIIALSNLAKLAMEYTEEKVAPKGVVTVTTRDLGVVLRALKEIREIQAETPETTTINVHFGPSETTYGEVL